jgi:hypothetical protein
MRLYAAFLAFFLISHSAYSASELSACRLLPARFITCANGAVGAVGAIYAVGGVDAVWAV